jgi:hypothetical protein
MRAALARLRHLPREARDTLFSLAVVAWTIVPHARNLPWWCMGLAALMLAWRARVALGQGSLPGRWVIVAVLALAAGLTWWSEGTLLGKEAGVTMLVVLIALKTLELRARRDAMVMFFLGFFLVLTQFLYSQSLLVALSMLVSVWGLLTALVLSHMPVGRPAFASAAAVAARAALLGSRVWARCGACHKTRPAAPACRAACAWARLRSWPATSPSPFACALRAQRRNRTRCTFAARCCRSSTAATGTAPSCHRVRAWHPRQFSLKARPWPTR